MKQGAPTRESAHSRQPLNNDKTIPVLDIISQDPQRPLHLAGKCSIIFYFAGAPSSGFEDHPVNSIQFNSLCTQSAN